MRFTVCYHKVKKEAKLFLQTGRTKRWGRAHRQISKGYLQDVLLL